MHSNDLVATNDAVVAIHHDRTLPCETSNPCPDGDQAGATCGIKAKVLVQIVIIESDYGRLEDMGGGSGSRRDPPSSILEEQGGLRLSASQAELTGK
jgi:hypothetical protein